MPGFWHGQGIKFIELIYLIDLVPAQRKEVNGIIIINLWMKVWKGSELIPLMWKLTT